MSHDDTSAPRGLPEAAAHRLLKRAVELDHARAGDVPLDRLRAAAHDAGISPEAFAAALAEADADERAGGPPPRDAAPVRRRDALVANVVALLAFAGILLALVLASRGLDVPWLVRKAVDPAALALGAAVAARLRARPVALLLAGLAVAQGAEFTMDAAYAAPAVHGAGAHLALMLAGIVGVLAGQLLGRRRRGGPAGPTGPAAHAAHAAARHASEAADRDAGPRRLLALRPRLAGTLVGRRPTVRAAAAFGIGALAIGGCAVTRTPLRPVKGSDLAMPERAVDRLVRGALQRCDTARVGARTASARDADPCRLPTTDTLARALRDSVGRTPPVP